MSPGAGRLPAPVAVLLAAGLAAATGGCRPADQETGSLDPRGEATRAGLPAEYLAALDSGSAAYRRGDLDAALGAYREAVELQPRHAAGWFGIYMVHARAGRVDAADSAFLRAQDAAPGATIIHPAPGDTVP